MQWIHRLNSIPLPRERPDRIYIRTLYHLFLVVPVAKLTWWTRVFRPKEHKREIDRRELAIQTVLKLMERCNEWD